MPNVRIVTDSSCDLPPETTAELGVPVVPLTIRFGSEELLDGTELSPLDFYAKMAATDVLPETAAPSPGAFEEVFRAAAADGAAAVVYLALSSKLSATIGAAQNAARAVAADIEVRVVDSLSVTLGNGSLVLDAVELADRGASADEIEAALAGLVERTRVFGVLDTLDNLKKGGRIGSATALVGSLLAIKPILDISSGEVQEASKTRTRRKAMEWMRDKLYSLDRPQRLSIVHGAAPDIEDFLDLISERYPRGSYTLGVIGPTIGAHAGPRVLGLCWQEPAG